MPQRRWVGLNGFCETARRNLPPAIYDYLEGGADDEWSVRNNIEAIDRYELVSHCLVDVSVLDPSIELLGTKLALPLMLAPAAGLRLFHPDKELGVARASAKAGVFFSLSTMATSSIEEVACQPSGPRMFQIYLHKDRGLTREFVNRCRAAGFQALCLTVDAPVGGNRERDARSGMEMPPRLSWRNLPGYLSRPRWSSRFFLRRDFRFANIEGRVDPATLNAMSVADYINRHFDRTVTWKDLEWLVGLWDGPFVLKGILSSHDAREAMKAGVTALMISNHGGRQLDGAVAPIDCIRPIRDTVGGSLELIVDGGIRRGSHVLKALALGANACSIGRPYLYALAAGGGKGVERYLELLKDDIFRSMALLGCRSLRELDGRFLRCENHREDQHSVAGFQRAT